MRARGIARPTASAKSSAALEIHRRAGRRRLRTLSLIRPSPTPRQPQSDPPRDPSAAMAHTGGWRAWRHLREDGARMPHRVCPWWLGYLLLLPLRRIWQNPRSLLGTLVREGMTVLEPGPGMGFFTLDVARMVGPGGRVVAVDVQERMLKVLRRRARKAGLLDRIDIRHAEPGRLGVEDLAGRVDLVLAIFVVHEMPEAGAFF